MPTNPTAFTGTVPQDGWLPADNGLVAAAGDLDAYLGNNALLTAGTLYLSKITIRQAVTAHNVCVVTLGGAGAGASTGSFTGLYNSAGTLLTGSSDIGATISSSPSFITLPLTTAQALAAGTFVWAAILVNLATTQPTLARNGGTGSLSGSNGGLTAATFRFATNGTLLASLPGSITPASNSGTGANPFWMGLS